MSRVIHSVQGFPCESIRAIMSLHVSTLTTQRTELTQAVIPISPRRENSK